MNSDKPPTLKGPTPMRERQPASPMAGALAALVRALADALHPRMIWWSLKPLLWALLGLGGAAWWGWAPAVEILAGALLRWSWSLWLIELLRGWGWASAADGLASALVLAICVPLVVVLCLMIVALTLAPATVRWVGRRRFPGLPALADVPVWPSLNWSLQSTVVALGGLLLSLPLWFVPPLGLVLPPLIWGWLTYRVMAFDTLAEHATAAERDTLLRTHRMPLLLMGIVTGYLGAAPAALWAIGVLAVVLAPVMIVASLWLYTFVFVLSCLWFSHYLLAALADLRARAAPGTFT